MTRTMRILTFLMLAVVVGTGQTWGRGGLGYIVFDDSEVTNKGEVTFYTDANCEHAIDFSGGRSGNLTSEALTAVMDGEDIIGYTVYIKAVPNYDYTLGAADNTTHAVTFITAEKTTNIFQAPRRSSPDPSIPRPNAIEVKATATRFVYSFTMPANGANATIHVDFPERATQSVKYVDVDGELKDSPAAYVIDGSETGLGVSNTTMWYVVPAGSVSYTSGLQCVGDVNLILADGATMAIGTADSPISGNGLYNNGGSISIYGQSQKTGKLTVYAETYGVYASGDVTISSCEVEATGTSNDAINAKTISLTDATVIAEGTNGICANSGALTISGGNVDATGTGDEGRGLYASGNINISWTDEENDFIDASSYNGTIVVADGQHFRAVSGENTMAFISGTLDKNDADDLDLINSLAGTTLVPFETNGYVVTTVDADLTAGDEPNFTNGDTKFYVYEKDATVTVDYTGEGIVQVTGMDAHTFAMPEEDVILTYKGEVLVDNNFTLANSSVDYNAEPQAPGIKYDDVDFAEAYYTLSYTKEGKSTPPSQVQNPGNYVVTLTGKGAYIGEVDINEVFVIMPSSAYATTLFAAGSTNQWMTWCGTEELVTPENVEVYTISGIDNSSVALEDITGSATFGDQSMNVIPAYTPVLIYRAEGNGALVGMFNAEGEGTPGIQTAEGTGCTFYGTTTALSTIPSDNYTAGQSYVLRSGNFVLIDENNGIPANKCWLTLNDTSAPLLGIVIGGETTNLSNHELHELSADGTWYSLDGRKLQGKPTKKGLYILNGKKVVIK